MPNIKNPFLDNIVERVEQYFPRYTEEINRQNATNCTT